MTKDNFQGRTNYTGDVRVALKKLCLDYQLGQYTSHRSIMMGYEDFNLLLFTSSGEFFIKAFAKERDDDECRRYLSIVQAVLKAGVSHPQLIPPNQDLYRYRDESGELRLCVMERIHGETLFESDAKLSEEDVREIAHLATTINMTIYKPEFIYDSWAVSSFFEEYRVVRGYLQPEEQKMLDHLGKEWKEVAPTKLPHALVHGDLLKTNIMRSVEGKFYAIDFSVSNFAPRIQELAVLFCDVFLDDPVTCQVALEEYEKSLPLIEEEIDSLPLYVNMAHAMHVIGGTRDLVLRKTNPEESRYWLERGRQGLGL